MKFAILSSAALLVAQASAVALPLDDTALVPREPVASPEIDTLDSLTDYSALEKRKGGGGRGGSSGGSSSSSSSSGSGSSGGSGSSSSSSSGGGASSGSRGTSSPATFGRSGNSYRGGAGAPFTSGGRSPRGITPVFFLGGAAVGAGALAYGAYRYDLDSATYFNQTANENQTSAVRCYCRRYQPCSCDRSDDEDAYVESLIGDGSYAAMQANKVTKLSNRTLYIDGSLDNGTSTQGNAATGTRGALEHAAWLGLAAAVGVAAWAF